MGLTKVGVKGLDDGTDGQIITYDANGNPVTVGPGTDGQVLTSTGAGSPPAFEALPASGAALTGSTDNTITTVTGANAIQGEANLVFDGTNLGVNIASPTVGYGGDKGIHIHSSTTTGTRGSSIHLTSGTSGTTAADGSRINTSDNDLVIQNMENGRLDLGTNGTHRLTIKGDGKIGINGDSPVNLLTISNSGQQTDSVGNLQIRYTGSESTYNSGLTTKSYSGTGQFMQWSTGGLRIGSRIITNSGIGNLYFTTGNDSVRAQLTGDGLILNGSDTAAANALDDYEEGTFTPTLPSGGTITNYYSGYTRVGRLVNWWVYCYFSSVPDNTTTFKIGGIPFNVGNHGGSGNYGGTGSFAYSSTLNVNKWNVVTWGGNNYINFHWNDTTASGATVKNESLTGATRYLSLGGSYYA